MYVKKHVVIINCKQISPQKQFSCWGSQSSPETCFIVSKTSTTLLPIEALSPTATSPTSGGPALGIVPSPGAIVTVQQSWHAVQAVFKWGDWKLQKGDLLRKSCVFFV